MLHQELDNVKEAHQSKIKTLECSIEKSSSKHQEEIAFFQKLLKEREEIDKQSERAREGECLAEQKAKVHTYTHIILVNMSILLNFTMVICTHYWCPGVRSITHVYVS